MNEVDNRTVSVDYPTKVSMQSTRADEADRDEMTMELATQLLEEVRLKARAERLAADLIHVLYEDEEVGEELADAVLEALIDQAHLALGYVRASQNTYIRRI
jgi:hypothetical protein